MDPIEILVGVTSLIAVIVSLITAATSSRRSAFEDLKLTLDTVRKELDDEKKARKELEKELRIERVMRLRIETWAHKLANQLEENHIQPAPLPPVENFFDHDASSL